LLNWFVDLFRLAILLFAEERFGILACRVFRFYFLA
jgi:hypothetical protein